MTMSRKNESTARRGAPVERRDHSLHDATLSLLDRAIDALASDQGDEAVHTARKATKRIRAALRLLRGSLGPGKYHRENRASVMPPDRSPPSETLSCCKGRCGA